MTLTALFIAQAADTHLPLSDQILLLLVAILSSKRAAGVTGAGFITLAATLSALPAVPVAGMALILRINRFMSKCRATTNFIGNVVATLGVARWQGELDEARPRAPLSRFAAERFATEPQRSIISKSGLPVFEMMREQEAKQVNRWLPTIDLLAEGVGLNLSFGSAALDVEGIRTWGS